LNEHYDEKDWPQVMHTLLKAGMDKVKKDGGAGQMPAPK